MGLDYLCLNYHRYAALFKIRSPTAQSHRGQDCLIYATDKDKSG